MTDVNRQWLLAARPQGMVQESDFEYREAPVPRPRDGELLVRTLYLSFDPAMRGWMEDRPSYVPPVAIGEPMRAGAVGQVLESHAPGFAAGDLSMEGNLAAYVDRTVLGTHTYKPVYDPEGILSTIPSIATALAGVLTGHLLRSRKTPLEKVAAMFVAGVAAMVVGYLWGLAFPVNKALWTSSYAVLTAGIALLVFAACYWAVEVCGWRGWATPFVVFGVNALALYFLSSLASVALTYEPAILPRAGMALSLTRCQPETVTRMPPVGR